MKQYRVKCLAVSGRGNKIHRFGDTVREGHFADKRADELVLSGHLELISEVEEVKPPVDEAPPSDDQGQLTDDQKKEDEKIPPPDDNEGQPVQEPKEDAPVKEDEKSSDKKEDESDDLDQMNDISIKDIKKQLTDAGIAFSKNESKEELYKKLFNA